MQDPKYQINPTLDPDSESGVYIPQNLEDCFDELIKMLNPVFIQDFRGSGQFNEPAGLSLWIRDSWLFPYNSTLWDYFKSLDFLIQPEDMCSLILEAFWDHLNNKPTNIQKWVHAGH